MDIGPFLFHIVDDESALTETMVEIIETVGFRARAFGCAEDYLAYMQSDAYQPPLAVLCDVRMPGASGYSLTLEIRRRRPMQRIVLMSGYADNEFNQQVMQELCCALKKPFPPQELLELIETLIACELEQLDAGSCPLISDEHCPLHPDA